MTRRHIILMFFVDHLPPWCHQEYSNSLESASFPRLRLYIATLLFIDFEPLPPSLFFPFFAHSMYHHGHYSSASSN
jgi:hypothetical protein